MSTEKANYGGGVTGNIFKGLKKRSPATEDSSRREIGKGHAHMDKGATRSGPSKAESSSGPRNA